MPNEERAQVRRARLRKAAEQIYEDSRLRDALTDEEAQRLLSWAYQRLEQAVEETEELPEEEAMPIVEGQSEAVQNVVRRVNAIMEQFSQTAEGEGSTSLTQLMETMQPSEERPEESVEAVAPETLEEMETVVSEPEEVDRETLFQRLMNRITVGEETE